MTIFSWIPSALGDGYFWLGIVTGMFLLGFIQHQMERSDARMKAELEEAAFRREHGIKDDEVIDPKVASERFQADMLAGKIPLTKRSDLNL